MDKPVRMAHLRVTPLSCFASPFSLFSVFVFLLRKFVSAFSLFLYCFQICFIAGISIRVKLFPP